jgi:hypothetical protein
MTNQTPDENLADLEIRIFQRQEQGYPVEITLAGQQVNACSRRFSRTAS